MNKNQKRLLLKGASNVRDIGGYPITTGVITKFTKFTKWKTFIRCEESQRLDEDDVSILYDYGIRTAIDLRCGWEALKNDNFYPAIVYKNIPMIDTYDNISEHFYFHMVDNFKDNIKRIFEYIGERISCGGIIYNCVSGKDRTGVISAILLLLCGVSELDVIADYMVSEIYLRLFAERHKLTPDKIGSNAEYMEQFVLYLNEKYSGAEQYLLSIGLSIKVVENIKVNFISNFIPN